VIRLPLTIIVPENNLKPHPPLTLTNDIFAKKKIAIFVYVTIVLLIA